MALPFIDVNQYLTEVTPKRDEVLTEMENYAHDNRFPIVGPTSGSFLHQMVDLTCPKRIFEMGSGFGYSAYWMAKALKDPEAKSNCTDGSMENAERAAGYFQRGGITDRIDYQVGNALEIIDQTVGEFDIIYNDIDKDSYPEAFHKALPRLRSGGLFITDNLLWQGRVMSDTDQSQTTLGIKELTRLLYESKEVFTTVIPLRDGLAVAVKY